MKEGWICPRCKKVNAPFIQHCDCQEKPCTNSLENCANGNHQWELISVSTSETSIRCKVCGKTHSVPVENEGESHIIPPRFSPVYFEE